MDDKIRKIAEHYGYDAQSRQLIEEMAELTKAFNKFWRKNLLCGELKLTPELLERLKETEEFENIVEEVADVCVVIMQIMVLLQMDISEIAEFKINRQLERIDSE